ncbi:hypothetical protein GE061_003504 [Apolygus lucorum]|uniref:Uncharacterized protein n=1 Tax=Apolygus lucorum TaxID=248454 RepID=A0A6A4JRN4_APOLU|nr:hypothetical protein GE061_003504 [Apolygus lucorum]
MEAVSVDQEIQTNSTTVESDKSTESKVNKSTPDEQALCSCPQKCHKRVPKDVLESLQRGFSRLGDNAKKNEYLQSSVYKRLWTKVERVGGRMQRRVSCKYKIPLNNADPSNLSYGQHKTRIHTNSRGKTSFVVNIKEGVNTIEVCQKAFMNIYGITEKRIRLQREKLIEKLRDSTTDSEFPQQNRNNGIMTEEEIEWSSEQAILEAFFGNQLWRPEYIGMSTDTKLLPTEHLHSDIKA